MIGRFTLLTVAITVAVAAFTLAIGHVLEHDRETAEDQLARDRLQGLSVASRELGRDLAGIGDDLSLSARLLQTADSVATAQRELATIEGVKKPYLVLEARTQDGSDTRIATPNAPHDVVELAAPVIDQMLTVAAGSPDELHISRGLSNRDDVAAWYRVFARRTADQSITVAAVVDMRLLVTPPEVLRADASRLLVLSAHGVPAPVSDPELADAIRTHANDQFSALVENARARHEGAVVLGAEVAASVGLPTERAVAAAVPVPIDNGPPWILAVVSSTDSLQERHHALVRRMALGGALGGGLIIVATIYIVRTSRRSARLQEQLRSADLLARMTEKALRAEKLATAGQLAAGIAHEIGTPLNVVRGWAEMMLAGLPADTTDAASLRIITEQIDHVTNLIRQLLDYAQPHPAHVEPIELALALDRVAALLQPEAASHSVTLRTDAPRDAGVISADPGQLHQLLVNLTMNAISACTKGGHVTLCGSVQTRGVVIEVVDDGQGITSEERAHIFDPFFTTKQRGQGTGLGLWIVAEVARAHEAALEVESSPGAGTTFRVVWPAAGERSAA